MEKKFSLSFVIKMLHMQWNRRFELRSDSSHAESRFNFIVRSGMRSWRLCLCKSHTHRYAWIFGSSSYIRSSYKFNFRVRWNQVHTWVNRSRDLRKKILKLLSILGECAAKLEDFCEVLYPLSDYCSFCEGNLCNEGSFLKSSLLSMATFITASCGKLFLSRPWISFV